MIDSEPDLTPEQLAAWNEKMFTLMVTQLATLPFNQLRRMHDQLIDQHAEAADSGEEPAASFALTAMGEAIRRRQIARQLN